MASDSVFLTPPLSHTLGSSRWVVYRAAFAAKNATSIMCPLERSLMSVESSRELPLTERKIGLFGEKNPICDCFQYNQMPLADQITVISPNMRILSYHLK